MTTRTSRSSLESALQARLLRVAPVALPDLRLFRRNVGSARVRGGAVVTFAIAGQCDLYAIEKTTARHIEIELKSATGSLEPDQRAWRNFCESWGIPHAVLKAQKDETLDDTIGRWCRELKNLK